MSILIATLTLMALMMLAMAVGLVFSGRRLRGSCGGSREDCECELAQRSACPRTKAQPGS